MENMQIHKNSKIDNFMVSKDSLKTTFFFLEI